MTKDQVTLADLSKIIAQATELKGLAEKYGEVDGEVIIGKQKFKLGNGE